MTRSQISRYCSVSGSGISHSDGKLIKRFTKSRSSHKVRFLGLGCVPNEPVQKLARVRICTLLARYWTSIRTRLAKQQIWTTMHCSQGSESPVSRYDGDKNHQRALDRLPILELCCTIQCKDR